MFNLKVWVKIKMGNPTAADPNITHFEVKTRLFVDIAWSYY